MEVEHCIRTDGEENRNFSHRIKRTVDKGWPDDLNGIEAAHHAAEREAQGRQRKQRYIDHSLKGLRPRYLQRKAQEHLVKHPNATWNDFCAQIIQKDLILEVSSTFLSHEAQTKTELATLSQEIQNLRSELKKNHVNAVAVFSRTFHPNQQGRQKTTRFCKYCRNNGHTLNWCRRKMRDEGVQKIRSNMSSKRNISPLKNSSTEEFNRRPPKDDITTNFFDLDDRSSPTIERLSNEEANWHHEAEQFTPPERRFFPRNYGNSFNVAEVKSFGDSDGESSDPLPLNYWSLQSLFCIFILKPFLNFFTVLQYLIASSQLLTSNPTSSLLIQITNIRHAFKKSLQQGLSTQLITWNSWFARYSNMMPGPHQKPNDTNSSLPMETKLTSTGLNKQEKQ